MDGWIFFLFFYVYLRKGLAFVGIYVSPVVCLCLSIPLLLFFSWCLFVCMSVCTSDSFSWGWTVLSFYPYFLFPSLHSFFSSLLSSFLFLFSFSPSFSLSLHLSVYISFCLSICLSLSLSLSPSDGFSFTLMRLDSTSEPRIPRSCRAAHLNPWSCYCSECVIASRPHLGPPWPALPHLNWTFPALVTWCAPSQSLALIRRVEGKVAR